MDATHVERTMFTCAFIERKKLHEQRPMNRALYGLERANLPVQNGYNIARGLMLHVQIHKLAQVAHKFVPEGIACGMNTCIVFRCVARRCSRRRGLSARRKNLVQRSDVRIAGHLSPEKKEWLVKIQDCNQQRNNTTRLGVVQ